MMNNRSLLYLLCVILVLALTVSETQARTFRSLTRLNRHRNHYNRLGELAVHRMPPKEEAQDNENIVVCDICPDDNAISPCTCVCHNTTSADIRCGSELTSCGQLTNILNVATPVSQYLRLVVQQTNLDCILQNGLWGPATFQEIILQDNHFGTIDNHAFVHFNSSLKVLNLENNILKYVCFSTLSEQPLIEKIYFGHNTIMFMPSEGSVALNQLKEIHLQYNLLKSIQSNTFIFMPCLELLDLSFNDITSIENKAFSFENRIAANQNLVINLSDNNIKNIPRDIVSGVEKVIIDLRRNSIEALPEEKYHSILENTNYQAKIWVSGNFIDCDIGICWIVGNATIKEAFDNFHCRDSVSKLYDLSIEELGCIESAQK